MKILNHLLYDTQGKQVSYRPTPNKGGRYTPQYLVIHYTAATTAESSIDWFMHPVARASAHLIIARDGTITQFAPFNIVTWHAGTSQWNGLMGLNKYSIGIELVNAGRLSKSGEKCFCPVDRKTVKNDDMIVAVHKNEQKESCWQEYTEAQLKAAVEIAAVMVKTYNVKDILGHDDIAPFRKSDPGPAFPMNSFRSKALGRKDESLDEYITTTDLNIRSGAGTNFNTLTQPLTPDTKVLVLKRVGNWSFVEVLEPVHGMADIEGWVFSKYLKKS